MSVASSHETRKKNQPSGWQRRLAAIFEICGVYMAGLLVAVISTRVLGIELQNPSEIQGVIS